LLAVKTCSRGASITASCQFYMSQCCEQMLHCGHSPALALLVRGTSGRALFAWKDPDHLVAPPIRLDRNPHPATLSTQTDPPEACKQYMVVTHDAGLHHL
jgi:hypothetical protein